MITVPVLFILVIASSVSVYVQSRWFRFNFTAESSRPPSEARSFLDLEYLPEKQSQGNTFNNRTGCIPILRIRSIRKAPSSRTAKEEHHNFPKYKYLDFETTFRHSITNSQTESVVMVSIDKFCQRSDNLYTESELCRPDRY